MAREGVSRLFLLKWQELFLAEEKMKIYGARVILQFDPETGWKASIDAKVPYGGRPRWCYLGDVEAASLEETIQKVDHHWEMTLTSDVGELSSLRKELKND